jgi:hypothetical protein
LMWTTKGQWLHINIINVHFSPKRSLDFNIFFELVSYSSNAGALNPIGTIFEGVLAIVKFFSNLNWIFYKLPIIN